MGEKLNVLLSGGFLSERYQCS